MWAGIVCVSQLCVGSFNTYMPCRSVVPILRATLHVNVMHSHNALVLKFGACCHAFCASRIFALSVDMSSSTIATCSCTIFFISLSS